MTIFHSEAVTLTVLLACALTVPAAAQQPSMPVLSGARARAQDRANQASAQTIRQEQQAQQAEAEAQQPAGPQSGPQPMSGQRVRITGGQQPVPQDQTATPATHTVREGDTLWALAGQYLGDPMLWPELYRLNTDVVEDPHWIYPGEELRLNAAAATAADTAAAPDTTAGITVDQQYAAAAVPDSAQAVSVPVTTGRTIFYPQTGPVQRREAVEVQQARAYRAVRRGEYFSSGFLSEGQALPSGRLLASYQTTVLGNIQTRRTANLFEDVIIDEPPGDTLQEGDMLLVFRRGDEVAGYGEVIRPTGILRVVGRAGNRYRATVIEQYHAIEMGQEYIRVAPFVYNTDRRAQPVADGVRGEVVALRDPRELLNTQDVIFLDKGADDGLRLGDVFRLYLEHTDQERGGTVEQDQALALVVNVRARSATAVLVELYRGDVRVGSKALQVRRMPS
jgi:hypothetical protein